MEYNKYLNALNYNNKFFTCLPIQLDATCNGFQHLALLSNETSLYEPLNLTKSTKDKDPQDFYSHILENLNVYIESERQKLKNKKNDFNYKFNKIFVKCIFNTIN